MIFIASIRDAQTEQPVITPNPTSLRETLYKQFGPLIGGADLRKALGFRSAASFQRAVRNKSLPVHIFEIPGRRWKFALTTDVAAWITRISDSNYQHMCPEGQGGKGVTVVGELDNAGEEVKM